MDKHLELYKRYYKLYWACKTPDEHHEPTEEEIQEAYHKFMNTAYIASKRDYLVFQIRTRINTLNARHTQGHF